MPYVYEDPIMRGQNPFARPVPVSSGMRDMTRPMPTRPTGQATNTQGQVPVGPGGRPSVDFLPGVEDYVAPPIEPGQDLILTDTSETGSAELQGQLQAVADREQASQQLVMTPEAGGSVSPMLGTGGFEFIGLIAIGALIYYMARA
tara:strand:- start:2267 stop:2704 length:438 start_codon:yes stop_codon:yes gene_type:complete